MIFIVFTMFFSSGFSADTLNIISPTYFGDQKIVYEEINYLENEILSFEFCSPEEPTNIEFNLVCNVGTDSELEVYENYAKAGCFFSNFDMSKSNCDDFSLEIDYTAKNKEKKFKRTFKKQKQSKLINHVLNLDYDVLNPVDLSYYLIVLNDIESSSSQTSINAYDKLKNDRNNNDKCWPKDRCDIYDTAKILRNLNFATYSGSSRLLDDGKNYLENSKISNTNNPTTFTITVDNSFVEGEEVLCSLEVDSKDPVNYEFTKSLPSLTKYASSSVNFNCNETVENIELKLLAPNGKIKDFIDKDDTSGISTTIEPFSCIGTSTCDFTATVNTLNAYGGTIESSALLTAYLKSLIISENDGEVQYLNTNNIFEDIGKYLYYSNNEGLKEYLKFKQNNVGSWGSDSIYNIILQTSWAVLGLQKVTSETEYVKDGKKWIYFNEPDSGWGDIEKNTLAYMAIKEQIKPYLKFSSVNEIEGEKTLYVENPTTHDLKDIKVKFSSEINDYVSYTESLGDLEGEDQIEFNVLVNDDFYSQLTGKITITGVDGKNKRLTLIDLPVTLKGPSPIDLVGGNYSITDEVPIVYVRLDKNIPQFAVNCKFTNPFDGSAQDVDLTQNDHEIALHNSVLKEGNFELKLDCSYEETLFNIFTELNIQVAKSTFNTVDELILTDVNDFSFSINDTSGEKQTLTFIVDGHYTGLIEPAEKSKLLSKDDVRDLFWIVPNPIMLEAYGNASTGNIIIKSSSGYMKKIPVKLQLEISEDEGMSWWAIFLWLIFLAFICLVVYRYYEMKIHEEGGGGGNGGNFDQGHSDDEYYFE